jgi:hypothetical protein
MNTLNLGSDETPATKKKSNTRNLKIALGLAAVILVPTIGSTLAGSITVGTGTLEFGQGTVTTAACDTSITVTPASALVADTFMATTVAVTGIDGAGCGGKTFTFNALNASNVSLLACSFVFGATTTATTLVVGSPCNVYTTGTNATFFTFRPNSPGVASNLIEKITVESN